MRTFAILWLALACVVASAQTPREKAPARRYGIEPDLETYPQNTPKDTLASVLKAIDRGRVDYLLAQLADPAWVDRRIAATGGKFDSLVEETTRKLNDDRSAVKQLRRMLREGEWTKGEDVVTARLKDTLDVARFRQVEGRWYFQNDKDPPSRSP